MTNVVWRSELSGVICVGRLGYSAMSYGGMTPNSTRGMSCLVQTKSTILRLKHIVRARRLKSSGIVTGS